MPSLTTFRIEFERPGAVYAPGEIVTGCIIVILSRDKKVRGLRLTIKGEAYVHWTKRHGRRNTYYKGQEQYFLHTSYLCGTSTGDADVTLPAGHSKYHFSFQLPYNIPCSFEQRNGHVRYAVKAVLDRPWKFDHECKAAFSVITPYDLNDHFQNCLGIEDEVTESFYCCFSKSGSVSLAIRTPITGYVPGQSISTNVRFFTQSSNVTVTRICTKLQRTATYYSQRPRSSTKVERTEVTRNYRHGPFDSFGEVTSSLQIPPIPPSELMHCNIIDIKYKLHVIIDFSGMHCSITRKYPILIGTIPLRDEFSAPGLTFPDQPVTPTAPLLGQNQSGAVPMPMPMPMPMPSAPILDGNVASTSAFPHLPQGQHMGSVSNEPATSTTYFDMPPPSYEECMSKTENIMDQDESNYVHGANQPFAPRYPVFNHLPPPVLPRKKNQDGVP